MTNSQHSPDQRLAAVRQVLDAYARTIDALAQSADRLDREIADLVGPRRVADGPSRVQ